MKAHKLWLVSLLLLVTPGATFAGTSIGIMGGVNLSTLDADFADMKDNGGTGFGIGGMVEIDFNETFAVQIQPMYLEKGEEITEIASPRTATLKPTYFEIPIMLKAYPMAGTARPFLMVGPSLGILLSYKADITDGAISVEADFKDITKTTDWGIVFGGGIAAPAGPVNFVFDLRYALGLSNINKGGTVPVAGVPPLTIDPIDVKTRGFQIMAGFSIPVGGGS